MKLRQSAALLALFTLSAGCAAEEAPVGPAGMTLLTAPLGECASNENRDRQFPSGADRVVIELSGGGVPADDPIEFVAPKGAETASGAIVVEEVPVGSDMTVRVVACNGEDTVWAGETRGVEVSEHTKSFPPVFLTPVDSLACTGSAESEGAAKTLSEPRGFAALVSDGDEAWVIGGVSGYDKATASASATATIDAYSRLDGEFTDLGGLLSPRAWALARRQPDGKILVVGGAGQLRFAQPGKPAIWVTKDDAPASASELYDPSTGTSAVDVDAQLPALPALAALDDGAVLAVGGVEAGGVGDPAGGVRSDNIASFSGGGAASSGRLLGGARFGATVVPLGGSRALVWGGNDSADVADLGVVVDLDAGLDAGQTALTVSGVSRVPIFAAGKRLPDSGAGLPRVLIAGGGVIQTGPSFPRDVAAPRLQIVTVDAAGASAQVIDVTISGLEGAFTRAAGELYETGHDELIWVGGYTAFQSNAICGGGGDCLQPSMIRFNLDLSGAPAALELAPRLDLSVGPFGARLADLGDGSALVVGGIETITQDALGTTAALVRYHGFERDLCGELPLP